jgi:hypothetical protein
MIDQQPNSSLINREKYGPIGSLIQELAARHST